MRTFATQRKPTRQTTAAALHGRSRSFCRPMVRTLPPGKENAEGRKTLSFEAREPGIDAGVSASTEVRHGIEGISVLNTSPAQIQPKLMVSASGDKYEREADRIAEQVMGISGAQLQRTRLEDAESGGGGNAGEQLHRKSLRSNDSGRIAGTPSLSAVASSPGRPLDPTTRTFMESRFGYDFSGVRVHIGSRAGAAAESVQARAFTLKSDIVFGPGQYAPADSAGRKLIAHELTHVIQQGSASRAEGTQTVRHQFSGGIQRQEKAPKAKSAEDAAFWEWWKLVVGFEGPLEAWKSNPGNKSDRGGETNWGVTKKMYMARAAALGLPATEEGFAAMTPDQAMLFGKLIWKSSGANRVKNTGVALVLADWYWGGIDLGRFSALLKEKGRAATFKEGMPDAATIDFLNTLPPGELVELMSNAKAAQYRKIVEKDPTQKKFLGGWLKRNEDRRRQAQPFVAPQQSDLSIWERAQRAMRRARSLEENASADQKNSVRNEMQGVVYLIDQKEKNGFAHAEEEISLKELRRELQGEIAKLN